MVTADHDDTARVSAGPGGLGHEVRPHGGTVCLQDPREPSVQIGRRV